ncbi:hypothetical protein [Microbispora amethystogenes]|uniref:DUF2721 domain-containing protein n=1 Tax=Microbispora amethystogenes TaxID=1427754 RepID=A0ABQ4FNZ5_9ACTN|nr:hypothetical protein [Microbispora amethystogenes]GIH36538.1 hypothetical protein Mam01_67020 [Microbispora amethystogenes]
MADAGLWLGLLLSIPLSILANIFTPAFQRYIAKRSERAAVKRIARDRKFKAKIDNYKKDPNAYQAYIHENILGTVVNCAFAILFATFFGVVSVLVVLDKAAKDPSLKWVAAGTGLISVISMLEVILTARSGRQVARLMNRPSSAETASPLDQEGDADSRRGE